MAEFHFNRCSMGFMLHARYLFRHLLMTSPRLVHSIFRRVVFLGAGFHVAFVLFVQIMSCS